MEHRCSYNCIDGTSMSLEIRHGRLSAVHDSDHDAFDGLTGGGSRGSLRN
jgi:hypothetical protein